MRKIKTSNEESEKPVILVIDDDRNVTATLARILRKEARVLLANDGATGLSIIRARGDIELVVLDITMPEYDAVELLNDMKDDGHLLPIVLFSGWRSDVMKDVARLAHYQGFPIRAILEKPVDGRQIVEALNNQSVSDGQLRECIKHFGEDIAVTRRDISVEPVDSTLQLNCMCFRRSNLSAT